MLYVRRITGGSMLPGYRPGQVVVFLRYRAPQVGDVVLLQHRGRDMIKRVGHIKDRKVFVFGDNRFESTDSRDFGGVSIDQVRAIAVLSF